MKLPIIMAKYIARITCPKATYLVGFGRLIPLEKCLGSIEADL